MTQPDEFGPWRRLGEVLRQHREASGLSVVHAAVAAGFSESVWRQLEKGERLVGRDVLPPNPRTETIIHAARAVNLDVNDALSIVGRPRVNIAEPHTTDVAPTPPTLPELAELSRLVERLEAAVEAITADRNPPRTGRASRRSS